MKFIIQTLSGLKTSLSFILHLFAIIALYFMAVQKGIDTSNVIMLVALSYGGTQTAKQISAHVSSSRDPEADTVQAIRDTDSR